MNDVLPDFDMPDDTMVLPQIDDGPAMAAQAREAAAVKIGGRRFNAAQPPDGGLLGIPLPAYPPTERIRTEFNPEGLAPRDGMTFGENVRGSFFSNTETGVIAESAAIEVARGADQPGGFQPSQLKNLPTSVRNRLENESQEDKDTRREAAYSRVFEQAAYDLSKSNITPGSVAGTIIGGVPSVANVVTLPARATASVARLTRWAGELGTKLFTSGVDAAVGNTVIDPVLQAGRLQSGGQGEYNVSQTALAPVVGFGTGALLRGAIELPSFVRSEARNLDLQPDVIAPPARQPETVVEGVDTPRVGEPRETAGEISEVPTVAAGRVVGESDVVSDIGGVERPVTAEAVDAPASRAADEVPAEVVTSSVEMTRAASTAPESIPSHTDVAPTPGRPAGVFMFDAGNLATDAKRFQYKDAGDEQGITTALKGVSKWDAAKANQVIVWQDNAGQLFVADGHQRTGLARRLITQGSETKIDIPGILYRESDGFSPEDVRAIAAAKNIAEGSGSPIDGAKVLRSRPELLDGSMPQSRTEARQSFELARLDDEAFGMVINDVVPYQQAAVVGRIIPTDGPRQVAAMKALARFEPRNETEATVLVQRVAHAELEKASAASQGSMFDLDAVDSTVGEEMRIVARVISDLKKDGALFKRVVDNAARIEETGSQIERSAAQSIAQDAELFARSITSGAYTKGPLRDALVAAAKDLKNGSQTLNDAAGRVLAAARTAAEGDVPSRSGDSPARAANDDDDGQTSIFALGNGKRQLARQDNPDAISAMAAREGDDTAPSPMSARPQATTRQRPDLSNSPQTDSRFTRRELAGEASKPRELPQNIRPEEVKDFRIGEAMQDLASRIGRKIELDNRFTLRNALGEYKPKDGVLRIRQAGDFEVFSHELGHAIDQYVQRGPAGAEFKRLLQTHRTELRKLDANTADPTKQTVKEGVAEFLRMAINNPAYAARQAPNFAAAFDDLLGRSAPDVRQLIADAARVSQIESGMAPIDLARSNVVPAVEPKGLAQIRTEAKRYGIPQTLDLLMNRFFANISGKDHYGKVLQKRLQEAQFENTGRPMTEFGWSNPYKTLRALPGAQQAAIDAIQNGVRAYGAFFDGPKSPSLYAALKEAGGGNLSKMTDETSIEYRSFSSYLTMRAALGRYDRFLAGEVPKQPVAMSYREVMQSIDDFEARYPQFRESANKFFSFNRAYWDKLHEAGLIHTELHDTVAGRGEDYVPLNRFFDNEATAGPGSSTEKSVVKRARGSTRPILDPIQQTMLNVAQFERVIAINETYRAYAKLAEAGGPFAGRFFEKIPNKELKGESVDVMEAIRQAMKQSGADRSDIETAVRTFEEFVGEDATATIFKNVDTTTRGENVVFMWENGERQAWKLPNDEASRGFFEMMSSMNTAERDLWKTVMGAGNAMFSQFITNAPQFALKNLIMDAMSRLFIARNTGLAGRIPFAPLVNGIVTHITDKEFTKAYAAMGGLRGGVVSSALRDMEKSGGLSAIKMAPAGAIDTAQHYAEMAKNPAKWPQFAWEAMRDGVQGYFKLLEATETVGRVGQAKLVYNHLKKQGLDDYTAMHGAIFEARDVLDYDRRGKVMEGIVKFMPFINPAVQGTARANKNLLIEPLEAAIQAYKRGGYDKLDGEMKSALKDAAVNWAFIAGGVALTMGYYASVKDDPAYQRASDYMKKRYFLFPLGTDEKGDTRYVSIPKPFDLPGAIFAAVEAAADGVSRALPDTWGRVGHNLKEGFIPRQFGALQDFLGSNPFFKTGFEVALGQKLGFEGSSATPMVPMNLKGLQAQDQYTGNSSEFAKKMGRMMGSSPIVVDHVINSIGGTAGRDVNDALTATIGNNPNMTPADAYTKMFFGALYRRQRGVGQMRSELAKDMDGDAAKVMAPALSYQTAVKNGDTDRAAEIYNAADEVGKSYMTLTGHAFPPQDRQMHPLEHAQSSAMLASALTRDLASNKIVIQDRSAKRGQIRDTIDLQPGEARSIMNTINSWSSEEIRNGLTIAGRPGYKDMPVIDTQPRLEAIRSISPAAADEIQSRLDKAHWIPAAKVEKNWGEVRSRLIQDRQKATLFDLLDGKARKASSRGTRQRGKIEEYNAAD